MTELRNVQADLARFRRRVLVAALVVLFAFGLLVSRLVYLQMVRHEDLNDQAENNRTAVVPIVPNRGQILDRNGIVLATNYSAYTLEITPSKAAPVEDTIDELAKVVDIQPRDRRRFKRLMEDSRSFESLPIRNRMTDEEVARFAAQRYRFPGVEIKARLFRTYPQGETASHVVGYIGRINQREKERIEDSEDAANYRGTDHIGKLGVEQSFESLLHGTTGVEQMETSAGGRAVRRLASSPATPGQTIMLSMDLKLQKLVEDMFGERRGALVAIDPRTGEILAFVSKPTFDPNLFVEGIDQESWAALNESINKPLLNRALRGTYPPGSTYKPFMALAALETGKRTPNQTISDPGFFTFGNHTFRDDKKGGHGLVDLYKSVVHSCDTYYYLLANDMGIEAIARFMAPIGFGSKTGVDIEGESEGILPSPEWKKRRFKKPEQKKWFAGETISIGIGQGYNSYTPMQLAQATAALANDGVLFRPHLVKYITDTKTGEKTLIEPEPLRVLPWKKQNVDLVKKSMVGVVKEGTAARAFAGAGYESGGKTGTAQVFSLKGADYKASKLKKDLHDHALYIAFAPVDKPKIALAVLVENGGFGAQSAAPIARMVLDYYLLGKLPKGAAQDDTTVSEED